jgi:pimeloyl-ACP methyl ester carboxylesterase
VDRRTALAQQGVGGWAESLMVPGKFAGMDGDPARRQWLIDNWGKTPTHVATALMECVMGFEVESLFPQVSVPTLILAPTRSTIQPLAGQVSIYEEIPGARIAAIEGPGHESYFDNPLDCTAALRRFLAELG